MGRWSQFEEDAYRLPEGFKRISYDADSKVYTFRDRKGKLYQGAPGEDYGVLTPVTNAVVRPGAFESDNPSQEELTMSPDSSLATFHDILPSNLITSAMVPVDGKSPPASPKSNSDADPSSARVRFTETVRRNALPKMQGVVHNLHRSVTSVRRKQRSAEEREGLLRRGSLNLSRSASMATTHSTVSINNPISIPRQS